ncbi:NADH-quinone oxidoreductase subunit J [Promicromonospora sp. NPDC057138]|uniref:NADH-quinone oxidoreductase subunit J n=1 Tax=Promicromonospora sp. NPDC057138 TaxID=3346031 RepID=UPI003631D306
MTPGTLEISGGETFLFWVIAPLMVLAALGLLFVKRAVHAAMCLVFVMVSMAILYITQEAPFLGVVQVVVYTGAVMMLFLFVLMLVGVDASDSLTETIRGQRWLGLLIGIGLAAVLGGVVGRAAFPPAVGLAGGDPGGVANPQALARVLFGDYVLAMEAVGVLLVTAAVGALVLTHRRRLTPKQNQRSVADARIKALPDGVVLTPLPSPGVYARSNAMDTPALGPDGEQVPQSVSRVLRIRGQERPAPHAAVVVSTSSTREGTSSTSGATSSTREGTGSTRDEEGDA